MYTAAARQTSRQTDGHTVAAAATAATAAWYYATLSFSGCAFLSRGQVPINSWDSDRAASREKTGQSSDRERRRSKGNDIAKACFRLLPCGCAPTANSWRGRASGQNCLPLDLCWRLRSIVVDQTTRDNSRHQLRSNTQTRTRSTLANN
jgi:hypothetical protein